MNPRNSAEDLVRFGVEAAFVPVRLIRDVGYLAVQGVQAHLEGRPDLVASRRATMPLNEAKIASQQLEIADNRLDFPTQPVTVAEEAAHKRGVRTKKAMRKNAINRLARAVLHVGINPIVPDEVKDGVVAIATEQQLDPERLDEEEFPENERQRISSVLEERQGNRPPFGARQLVRAIFRP